VELVGISLATLSSLKQWQAFVVAYLAVIDFVIPVSCGAIIPRVML
jgi:hypothetical protein